MLSVTARVDEHSGSREPGAQVTVSVAVYSATLGKGFPDVTALLTEESSPSKVVTVWFRYPECNNYALLGEGFPCESVTALLCSAPPSPASPVKF